VRVGLFEDGIFADGRHCAAVISREVREPTAGRAGEREVAGLGDHGCADLWVRLVVDAPADVMNQRREGEQLTVLRGKAVEMMGQIEQREGHFPHAVLVPDLPEPLADPAPDGGEEGADFRLPAGQPHQVFSFVTSITSVTTGIGIINI
jgi:hypothetical protein